MNRPLRSNLVEEGGAQNKLVSDYNIRLAELQSSDLKMLPAPDKAPIHLSNTPESTTAPNADHTIEEIEAIRETTPVAKAPRVKNPQFANIPGSRSSGQNSAVDLAQVST